MPTVVPRSSPALPRDIRCDIFCAVVDNFGDIGVSWRLARQLRQQAGWRVRLWVDDLTVFARLCPSLVPGAATQMLGAAEGEIEIAHWQRDPAHPQAPQAQDARAEVVIEAFACELPETYVAGMAQRLRAPIWINLDYLSAETWVADFHLQPSPHPRYAGLSKTFFFPGLRAGTGGVLHEQDLDAAREAFLSSPAPEGPASVWAELGIAPPAPNAVVVSLFAYENLALASLLDQWREYDQPIVCIVPEGRISPGIARYLGRADFAAGTVAACDALTLCAVGFMDSALYDRLLWSCDLNFVRGEDSFARALWAARPLVWQLYPQADEAHLVKLDAALDASQAALGPAAQEAETARAAFWHAWNTGLAPNWRDFWRHRDALTAQAVVWAKQVAALGGLAQNLAEYVENRLK